MQQPEKKRDDKRSASDGGPQHFDNEEDDWVLEAAQGGPGELQGARIQTEAGRDLFDRIENYLRPSPRKERRIGHVLPDGATSDGLEDLVYGAILQQSAPEHEPQRLLPRSNSAVEFPVGEKPGTDNLLYVLCHVARICPCPECYLDREQQKRASSI